MAEPEASFAVRCTGIVKFYPARTGQTQALRGVEADFAAGSFSAVTGPSGSGKSTLLAIVALWERPSGGELDLCGRSVGPLSARRLVALRRSAVARVAQRPADSLLPQLRAGEQVAQAARLRGVSAVDPMAVLDRFGLTARAGARPAQLSGGEQQRLAVAVATAVAPPVLVADEPTAELDDASAAVVLAELHRCAEAGSAVIIATHDRRAIAAADRVLALRHGVLSTERTGVAPVVTPIDGAGRLQLPPEALALFPVGRAVVEVDEHGVHLRPPA